VTVSKNLNCLAKINFFRAEVFRDFEPLGPQQHAEKRAEFRSTVLPVGQRWKRVALDRRIQPISTFSPEQASYSPQTMRRIGGRAANKGRILRKFCGE
jgi:hypothetical protein